MKKIRDAKGFTLIELLIVVAIIGIIAAIAVRVSCAPACRATRRRQSARCARSTRRSRPIPPAAAATAMRSRSRTSRRRRPARPGGLHFARPFDEQRGQERLLREPRIADTSAAVDDGGLEDLQRLDGRRDVRLLRGSASGHRGLHRTALVRHGHARHYLLQQHRRHRGQGDGQRVGSAVSAPSGGPETGCRVAGIPFLL